MLPHTLLCCHAKVAATGFVESYTELVPDANITWRGSFANLFDQLLSGSGGEEGEDGEGDENEDNKVGESDDEQP